MQTSYQHRINAEPVDLVRAAWLRDQAQQMLWRRCILTGSYDPRVTYLLDNQVFRGVVGYQVFSRFVLVEGIPVLIDRGWVAAPVARSDAPQIDITAAPVTLTGVAKPVPVSGIKLADGSTEKLGNNLIRVQRIELAQIAAENNRTLLPYIVRLDPTLPGSLTWNGTEPGFGRDRHLGYAYQWFALAATLLVIYFVVNTKKRSAAGND